MAAKDDTKMMAVRVHEFGEPEVLKYESIDRVQPGKDQVVVQVKAAGLNPVDTYIRTGTYVRKPALPYTPGADCAGVISQVGEGVENFCVGDRVYTAGCLTGSCAEYTLCSVGQVHPLPDCVSFEQGAGVNVPYGTAYRALIQRAKARSGDVVLVHGASGGVGVACVQFAKSYGMIVIGTAGTEKGREMVKDQGANCVLDHTQEGYLEKVMEFTNNRGVDVVLEMLANKNLSKDLSVLAKNGRVAVIGNRGTIEINPRDLMKRNAAVLGVAYALTSPEDRQRVHAAILGGLNAGVLKPVVGKKYSMKNAAQAHHDIIEKRAFGKNVLVPEKV